MLEPEDVRSAREFKFTQRDFSTVRRLIHEIAGISLQPSKYEMVYNRLSRRLRVRGENRFDAYLKILEEDVEEQEAFVNALTTNLTSFFREEDQFRVLAEYAVAHRSTRPLRIWCAASSTGEEAYSIAMCVAEAFKSVTPRLYILASDLDSDVLSIAKRGVYPIGSAKKLEREFVARYFMRGKGGNEGYIRVKDGIRGLIEFQRINLLDNGWDIGEPFDAVFCRNVLIYFNKETQGRVLENMRAVLRPDGLLFTGKAESLMHASGLFLPLGKCVYRPAPRIGSSA